MHRTFSIEITGIAPLVQDNPHEADMAQLCGKSKKKTASKQEQGEAWREKVYKVNGHLGHPSRAFESLVREAAKNFKGRGRASMKDTVRQCCWVDRDWLVLTNRSEPDEVMVSTPMTLSGRVPSYLPVFRAGWKMEFHYQCTDDEIVTPGHLHEIISWGGQRIGLGKAAFRPKFGRFIISKFEEIDMKDSRVA